MWRLSRPWHVWEYLARLTVAEVERLAAPPLPPGEEEEEEEWPDCGGGAPGPCGWWAPPGCGSWCAAMWHSRTGGS